MALEVDPATVARLGEICLRLPGVVEEAAWVGARWRVRGRTFAHVLPIVDGRAPGYAQAAGLEGPAIVLTFRITETERELFTRLGLPYWAVRWGRDVGGVVLGDGEGWTGPGWDEIAELVTDSYCLLAPQRLAAQVARPGGADPISGGGRSLAE